MVGLRFFIVSNFVLLFLFPQSDMLLSPVMKHTINNIKPTRCTFHVNPKRLTNSSCKVKAISRGVSELNVYMALLEPLRNFSTRFEIFKLYNGYRPFMLNITENWCDFMAGRRQTPVLKIATKHLKNTSNLNTTCPYEKFLLIKGFRFAPEYFPLTSVVPRGKYKLSVTMIDDTKVEPYIGTFSVYSEVEENIQPLL